MLQTDDDDEDNSERMLLQSMPPRLLFQFERAKASAENDSKRMLLESYYSSLSARWPPSREEGTGVRVPPRATASGGRRCTGKTNAATPCPERNVRRRRRRLPAAAVTKNTLKFLMKIARQ